MSKPNVVSHDEWIEARKDLLRKEKELTRLRDELSEKRRELPWERVDKEYVFVGPDGRQTLADLFEGRRQLVVCHFMFAPDWDAGCPSCSFWADSYDGNMAHLNHRDVSMVVVSRAPLEKLQAYRDRMGWSFRWLSSGDSDFNFDHQVSFTDEDEERGEVTYNYGSQPYFVSDLHGISVFYRDDDGQIYHTYSTYARGVDPLNVAYQILDLTPRGRDEADGPMRWLRRRDEYDD